MVRSPLLALPLLTAGLLSPSPLALAEQARPSIDQVGRALMADLQRAGEDMASEALAQWIMSSRSDAVKAGVHAIPTTIRSQLRGHFPEPLLARVRYRVGTGKEYSLQTHAFKGNAVAITLDDVILFRPEGNVVNDARLWAHELTHVQQYERWGVRGFARRYTLDHAGVEAQATAGADRFIAARKAAAQRPASGRANATALPGGARPER